MKSQKKKVGPKGKKKEFHFGLHDCIESNRKKLPWGRPSGKCTTCSGNGREAIENGFWEKSYFCPPSFLFLSEIPELVGQTLFGMFLCTGMYHASVNEGWQADAHTHTHTRGEGRQRKRCCVEPEDGISHLRTIKCCRTKSQKKKGRPKGKKKEKIIPFRTARLHLAESKETTMGTAERKIYYLQWEW
ncbi:hypothetical protein CDAR_425111 [Caerostris darwini]|uniref:Uncharacterized protein n=1 Tax=Caerostris darwini TaxID=1538125 RepID=A0AAV4X7N2_9ARAC|nr:hypothetical protein CDAR_425111 [Caerostris darwini]